MQILAGFFAEGNTDTRFLEPIIERTLQSIAMECSKQIDISVHPIKIDKKDLGFSQQVIDASKKGFHDFGINILCVHTDADDETSKEAYRTKINPAINELNKQEEQEYCKNLVAVIPVQETEAWMLADTELLKDEIGTTKSDKDLNLNRNPEDIANPKEVIKEAIQIVNRERTKKRRKEVSIDVIYLPIGQGIDIKKLDTLPSYQDFKNSIRGAFKKLKLL